jgi:hypothetical protein
MCDFTTTQISSKYVDAHHTDHGEKDIELIKMYPAEGPMLKAPVVLDPLMVSCLKSQTKVGAGRCTHCRPLNVHQEVDDADLWKKRHHQEGDEDVPMKKETASSCGDAPQTPDHPYLFLSQPKWQNQPTPVLDTTCIARHASPRLGSARRWQRVRARVARL